MLLSLKRLLRLVPVLLIIVLVIAVTTYRDQIMDSFSGWAEEKSDESITGRIVSSVIVGQNSQGNDEDTDEESGMGEETELTVTTTDGSHEIVVEIADDEEERMEGLMGRESLCDDCGMLFIFESDSTGGFWMKNCLIPLDIIFIDEEGLIVDMKENFEPCPEYPCPSYVPDHSYRYVLEVNGGWAGEHGVDVGDDVKIPFD